MQKTAAKNSLYSKKGSILKIAKTGHQAKAIYSLCKILTLGEKLKMQKKKHTKNVSITHCASQNGSQSKNETILKIAKKWPPSKGYSLCKILTLGQKWKIQKIMLKTFLQHTALVLWKKLLPKRANIRKMKAFWKLAKIATKQRL